MTNGEAIILLGKSAGQRHMHCNRNRLLKSLPRNPVIPGFGAPHKKISVITYRDVMAQMPHRIVWKLPGFCNLTVNVNLFVR